MLQIMNETSPKLSPPPYKARRDSSPLPPLPPSLLVTSPRSSREPDAPTQGQHQGTHVQGPPAAHAPQSLCDNGCVLDSLPLGSDIALSELPQNGEQWKEEEREGGEAGRGEAVGRLNGAGAGGAGQSRQEGMDIPACRRLAAKSLKPKIPGSLRCLVAEAVREFHMIGEGDKVLVGLSGGKDSLTMLHVLLELKRRSPVKFEVAAATVDPQTPEYDPWPLVPYLEQLGVRYHMLSKPIIDMAKTCMDPKRPSLCSFCSRMKRGMLYSCMREHGYTCLALGQHLDDGECQYLPAPTPDTICPCSPLLSRPSPSVHAGR